MFVKQSQAELQAAVVRKTSEDFYFSVVNSPESDPEDFALTATGSARFFAALAANGVIHLAIIGKPRPAHAGNPCEDVPGSY
jgi:hypothetical protein